GSVPNTPPIEGLADVDCLTSDTFFGLTRRPGHLIVVGAGPTGVEIAQAFRRLGSRVTIGERGRAPSGEGPEIAGLAPPALKAEGVELHEAATVQRVERRGKTGVRVHIVEGEAASVLDGTHLLLAAGRRPDLAGLDLESAGIVRGAEGIVVSDQMRTSNRR